MQHRAVVEIHEQESRTWVGQKIPKRVEQQIALVVRETEFAVGQDLDKSRQSAAVRNVKTVRFAVGERRRPRSDEERVGCCNQVGVGFNQMIVALNGSPQIRVKPRLRRARLDVFRTIAETLLYPHREPDAVPALFERWIHQQEPGGIAWRKSERGPWKRGELARPWKAIREHAGMPEVIPYALRHSSIVRGLRKGLPIQQVAKLHNTSVKMIERHYAKYVATALEDLARAAVVSLVPRSDGNVVPTGKRA